MTYRYSVELSTVREIKGPLLFIEKARNARYEEIVEIRNPQGEVRRGRVLDVSEKWP